MKKILLLILVVFSSLVLAQEKVKVVEKSLLMEGALQESGMDAKSFFNKYKKIINHRFSKDMADINYRMLKSFLRGLQDKPLKEDEEIIISVDSSKSAYTTVHFYMHALNTKKQKIESRKIKMTYRIISNKENEVRTIVTMHYSWLVENAIKLGLASDYAVPKQEILTMRYDPIKNSLIYDIKMKLVTDTHKGIVDKTFQDTFQKIEKIASQELVPAINAIED